MQKLVIHLAGEDFFVIEEMHLLLVAHVDVWVFRQKIMQRCRPRFLCAGQNETQPLYFARFLRHRCNL